MSCSVGCGPALNRPPTQRQQDLQQVSGPGAFGNRAPGGRRHTTGFCCLLQLIPADMAPPESRIRIPESRSWIVHRSLSWKSGKKSPSIHRDLGILIRDSGGAMSAGISCSVRVLTCSGTCGSGELLLLFIRIPPGVHSLLSPTRWSRAARL